MQTRQHAVGVVPTEGQDLLLNMMWVVFVKASLSPVVHLAHREDTLHVRRLWVWFGGWAALWLKILYLIAFEMSTY